MTKDTVGREPIQIVEILQPLCANTYGSAPCTASGDATLKCYNVRATCQDPSNYELGTSLSLYFGKGRVAEEGLAPYIVPSLVSVATSPTKINTAGVDPDAQGLGNRALATVVFQDHQHTDRIVDPYLGDRTADMRSADRGSFWARWLVRNKYRQNMQFNIYEGYAGQTLAQMIKRTYFVDSFDGPDSQGRVTMKGKDILSRIEERKAQAPKASDGELYIDIDAAATSFEVAGALASEYDATGTIIIDDEIMTYTGVATSTNGIEFTGVTRGTDLSTAAAHTVETRVQQCLRFTDLTIDATVTLLLDTYGAIPTSYYDSANWTAEVGSYLSFFRVNGLITEPESVAEILSQLQVQALFYLWWDERAQLIKLKAIRGIDAPVDVLTAEANILPGTFKIKDMPRQRISQAWVYYDPKSYVEAFDNPSSYKRRYITANLESETDELNGSAAIKAIFARFTSNSSVAANTSSKIVLRYVETPRQIEFKLDSKDRDYWTGDTVGISHHAVLDQYGLRDVRNYTIISAKENLEAGEISYVAEDTTLYGVIYFILGAGAADYPGAATAALNAAYIGNAAGLLSDGTPCATIS